MARIAGIDLPKEKRIDIALAYLYGVGRVSAKRILAEAQVDPAIRTKQLSEDQIARITTIIQRGHKIEGELRREQTTHIKRFMDINCYRGLRHKRGLPVRGQRTHTNARTRKGRRRPMGAMPKPAEVAKEAKPAKAPAGKPAK